MKNKYIKFVFDNTFFIAKLKKVIIDCPNESGRIGDIICPVVGSIWTGAIHIYTKKVIRTPFTYLSEVYVRSSLDEADEEWKLVFKYIEGTFSNQMWFDLANEIRRLQDESSLY